MQFVLAKPTDPARLRPEQFIVRQGERWLINAVTILRDEVEVACFPTARTVKHRTIHRYPNGALAQLLPADDELMQAISQVNAWLADSGGNPAGVGVWQMSIEEDPTVEVPSAEGTLFAGDDPYDDVAAGAMGDIGEAEQYRATHPAEVEAAAAELGLS